MVAKYLLDGLDFGPVAERRARAVGVDVVDLFGRDAGIAQGVAHHEHHAAAAGVGRGDVVGIRRHAAADELGVHFCAPRLGVLVFFEHQRAGPFAEHEAVAVLVVGPRGRGRVVVALAHGLESVEAAHARFGDGCLGAARNHGIGQAEADVVEGRDDGIVRRGAGRSRYEIWPAKAVFDADVARRGVGNHARNEEGRVARGAVAPLKLKAFFLQRLQAADAGAPNHAHPVLIDPALEQARIGDGLVGGHHRELREQVHLAVLLAVEKVVGLVAFHFAGKSGFEPGRVESRDGGRAARARAQAFPISRGGIAQRCDGSKAGNDNPSDGRHKQAPKARKVRRE